MRGKVTILLSSAGRRHALLQIMRRTLADLGLPGRVVAADMTRLSAAYQDADQGYVVPRCTSPEFVPASIRPVRSRAMAYVVWSPRSGPTGAHVRWAGSCPNVFPLWILSQRAQIVHP